MKPPDPLTIGIDARELLGEPTGVGRYLGELLRRWIARADARSRRLILYTPETLSFMATVPDTADVHEVVAGSGRGTWWEQTHLRRAVRSDPPDVFFAGAYTAPLALGVPLAVTIHDVSFAARPDWFRPRGRPRSSSPTRSSPAGRSWNACRSPRIASASFRPASRGARRAPGRASHSCSSWGRSSTGGGCPS